MNDSSKSSPQKNNSFCLFDSETTKIARIKAKTERKKALLENKARIEEIHSSTPKEKVIKTATLVGSLVVVSVIAILSLSSLFVFKIGCVDMHKILSIASTTLSIVLSIIAIIFTFNSGLNLENRFHDIEKLSGEIKQLNQSVNMLAARHDNAGKEQDQIDESGYSPLKDVTNNITPKQSQ